MEKNTNEDIIRMQIGSNELLTINAGGQVQLKGKLEDNRGGPRTPDSCFPPQAMVPNWIPVSVPSILENKGKTAQITNSTNELYFRIGPHEYMTISNSGKVGIGNSSPNTLLDV